MKYLITPIQVLITLCTILLFSSCRENENDLLKKTDVYEVEDQLQVIDNRLKFSSSDFLSRKIGDLKEMSDSKLVDELDIIYNSDVFALRPIVNERNLEFITQRYLNNYNHRILEEQDDISEYISDDFFAALVNDEGLLQVSDSIYKYTPFGIFIVHENSLDHLNKFISELTGSISKRINARMLPIEPCPIMMKYSVEPGVVSRIDSEINYFIPLDPCLGPGPSPSPTPTPAPSPVVDKKEVFINNLSFCDTNNGWWPLGHARICKDYFTNRSRIKTKFWNQNYVVFQSIGTKVKHQFKSLIWYDAKIDELELGIKAIDYVYEIEFDMTSPWSNSFVMSKSSVGFFPGEVRYDLFTYNFLEPSGNVSLPAFPFDADLVIYMELPYGDDYKIESNRVNKELWKKAWAQGKNFLKKFDKPEPADVLLVLKGTEKIGYTYANIIENEKSSKMIEHVFDWKFEISVTLKLDAAGQISSFAPKPVNNGKYTDASIEVYGIGRRGSGWKGSLLKVDKMD